MVFARIVTTIGDAAARLQYRAFPKGNDDPCSDLASCWSDELCESAESHNLGETLVCTESHSGDRAKIDQINLHRSISHDDRVLRIPDGSDDGLVSARLVAALIEPATVGYIAPNRDERASRCHD